MGGEKRAREQDENEATGEVEIAFDRQYDRQIRLWGKNAQNRMSKAKVLVFGMRGLSVEICKNIVLAGECSLFRRFMQQIT